jgi:hypothetical protein
VQVSNTDSNSSYQWRNNVRACGIEPNGAREQLDRIPGDELLLGRAHNQRNGGFEQMHLRLYKDNQPRRIEKQRSACNF